MHTQGCHNECTMGTMHRTGPTHFLTPSDKITYEHQIKFIKKLQPLSQLILKNNIEFILKKFSKLRFYDCIVFLVFFFFLQSVYSIFIILISKLLHYAFTSIEICFCIHPNSVTQRCFFMFVLQIWKYPLFIIFLRFKKSSSCAHHRQSSYGWIVMNASSWKILYIQEYIGCLKKKKKEKKKAGVANYQYFMNSAIYQCDILRHGKYNFHLGVCKVSIQHLCQK